jgi:prepilin-type N-terminal cleavage/methylation domain-containing protein
MKMNLKKGFTLIELLVVVAIIGILASVVLASLNTARTKGADSAIKANLSGARAQAEIFYTDNTAAANTYTNVCAATVAGATTINSAVKAAAAVAGIAAVTIDGSVQTTTTANCFSSGTAWVAQVPLKSSGYWCVDSTGKSQANANVLAASAVACP